MIILPHGFLIHEYRCSSPLIPLGGPAVELVPTRNMAVLLLNGLLPLPWLAVSQS